MQRRRLILTIMAVLTAPFLAAAVTPELMFRVTAAAIYRLTEDHFHDVANIKDFGADPTGTADSTAAWNLACADATATGVIIRIPAGTYAAASPWVCNRAAVRIVGDGDLTVIRPTHNGVAMSLTPGSVGLHTMVEGVTFDPSALTSPATAALAITYPLVGSFPYETTLIRDVKVLANSTIPAGHFTAGLLLNGLWQSRVERYAYWSNSGLGVIAPIAGTHAIEVANTYDVTVFDILVYGADIAVYQTAQTQGLHLVHPNCIGVNYCFKNADNSSSYINGYNGQALYISDGECTPYIRCVDLNRYVDGDIHGLRMQMLGDGSSAAGISLLDTSRFHIGFNPYFGASSVANAPGLTITQGAGGFGFSNRSDNFTCFLGNSCVTLGSGTMLNVVANSVQFTPTAFSQGFSDGGTNNFMSAITGKGRVMQTGGFVLAGSSNQTLAVAADVTNAVNVPVLVAGAPGVAPALTSSAPGGATEDIMLEGSAGGHGHLFLPPPCSGASTGELCSNGSGAAANVK